MVIAKGILRAGEIRQGFHLYSQRLRSIATPMAPSVATVIREPHHDCLVTNMSHVTPMSVAARKATESLYHLSPQGFWKKFRDVVSANPTISSGLPIPNENRDPPPASRPEKYSTPATKASDIADNPYWKRDVRRAYPQLSMITQSELSALLIQHAGPPVLAEPSEGTEKTDVPANTSKTLDLSEAIAAITTTAKVYSESNLPPPLPTPRKRWAPELSPPAPHDEHSYFPMSLYQ